MKPKFSPGSILFHCDCIVFKSNVLATHAVQKLKEDSDTAKSPSFQLVKNEPKDKSIYFMMMEN